MRGKRLLIWLLVAVMVLALAVAGCGEEEGDDDLTEGRPESVTAYQAAQYTRPKADKWQEENWVIQVRDGDPDGVDKQGKAKIWEVYYFSPRPEEDSQMFVIYNRGNVWPNDPTKNKGGEEGRKTYQENEPQDFRVDSPEAVNVALRNGGGEYLDGHPDAETHVVLRCKADYDAVGEDMPAPKYKWIWDVYYKEPKIGAEVLHVYIDGMNGEYITKELETPPS